MNKAKQLRAPAWITLALVAGAIEPIVAKFALKDGASALQLILLKNCLGALFMLPVLFKYRSQIAETKSLASGKIVLPGILLFATNTLTLLSLQSISVVLLITIVSSVPAIVALMNSRLGRDKLSVKFWIGFLLCFLGIVLTLDYKDLNIAYLGLIFALTAALSSSVYRVHMEILCDKNNPKTLSALTFALQGILSLCFYPFVGEIAPGTLVFGSWIGLSAAIANLAFISALNLVGSTRISVLTMLQRPLLIIVAAVTLHETVNLLQAIGIVAAMLGLSLAQVERQKSSE